MSKICIPVRAKSVHELKRKMKMAEKYADILEIWLDYLPKDVNPAEIMRFSARPLLIVNKTAKEGALLSLIKWLDAGVTYVDLDVGTSKTFIRLICANKKKTKLILSWHDYKKTPPQSILNKILKKGFARGADIVKIVAYARTPRDNFTLLNLLAAARKKNLPVIAFAMGKYGKISRILAPDFGSAITYVALNKKEKTAPGQLTVKEYKTISLLLQI